MAKSKSVFFCQQCGYESAKWMGQCPACREWNTFTEEPVVISTGSGAKSRVRTGQAPVPKSISEISGEEAPRITTGIGEFDRVLGGGAVPGSLILVGGDPGIGKSTLLLQTCRNLAASGRKVLYISGEESLTQIRLRAERLGDFNDHLKLLCETDLTAIEECIASVKPECVIIDSIQTMCSADVTSSPGSVSQVRESTNILLRIAKSMDITVFIVGHVTKEGTVAGPRVLEHMVDTVLYFEGDRHASYRVLRGVKNRFGSTNEIGVFEMSGGGLIEVTNASAYMLEGRPEGASGSVVVCSMEGTRPILLEIQALITRTSFGMPRRQAAGADYNRVNLLMAVLERRTGLKLSECDAYVNLTGGIRIQEPALDLGMAMAIASGFKNRPVDPHTVVFGEVGLSGEVRSVSQAEARVREAARLGFDTCIIPLSNAEKLRGIKDIKLIGVSSLDECMPLIG
ncbi:MAG: DNA repair protein RadA [Lachnospiraceae bacterium]|nr:DNA repair protein RadA [Lachnospiraceae bacterium]